MQEVAVDTVGRNGAWVEWWRGKERMVSNAKNDFHVAYLECHVLRQGTGEYGGCRGLHQGVVERWEGEEGGSVTVESRLHILTSGVRTVRRVQNMADFLIFVVYGPSTVHHWRVVGNRRAWAVGKVKIDNR